MLKMRGSTKKGGKGSGGGGGRWTWGCGLGGELDELEAIEAADEKSTLEALEAGGLTAVEVEVITEPRRAEGGVMLRAEIPMGGLLGGE